MELTRLKAVNFKNYAEVRVEFDQKVNIIYGDNGSGKTNLLDAIHFLSVSKSYFGQSDKYLIRDEEEFYRLEGTYQEEAKNSIVAIKYKRDQQREIKINTKKLRRVNELIGQFPVVLIAPDDIKIVKGGSKDRRDYFNKWLCQSNPEYLAALVKYNRLLRQKDALLKSDHPPSALAVEAYNHQLIPLASELHAIINDSLSEFIPIAKKHYQEISAGADQVEMQYLSELTGNDINELFKNLLYAELKSRRPLVGVQRDDYDFVIEQRSFKKYGSQGQIKSLLYSLRLAEFDFLKSHLKKTPILILDDFFEKLDRRRLSSLIQLINSNTFGQVFLSDTELDRSKEIFTQSGINFGAYRVDKGTIQRDS